MICVIGHPFSNLGTGEHMRSTIRALDAVLIPIEIVDVYKFNERMDSDYIDLVGSREVSQCTQPIRIFNINGDEIDQVLEALSVSGRIQFDKGFNIIFPAWELGVYPEEWAKKLALFDEVWAISQFNAECFSRIHPKVAHIGQVISVAPQINLPRSYFGIPETSFLFLNFFDFTSYSSRKNPEGVIKFFLGITEKRPLQDLFLVLKSKGKIDQKTEFEILPQRLKNRVVFIEGDLSTFEMRSLISTCDCYVSLHRAEGFGRGPAEAMAIGKVAMATGWSGNLDYMSAGNSLLVNYDMTDVAKSAYPFGEGQIWAEPNIDHAIELALSIIENPSRRSFLERRAVIDVRSVCSPEKVGLRILDRLRRLNVDQAKS